MSAPVPRRRRPEVKSFVGTKRDLVISVQWFVMRWTGACGAAPPYLPHARVTCPGQFCAAFGPPEARSIRCFGSSENLWCIALAAEQAHA